VCLCVCPFVFLFVCLVLSVFYSNIHVARRLSAQHFRVVCYMGLRGPYVNLYFAKVAAHGQYNTRTPCCRKETARCRSSSFRFKVRRQHSQFHCKFKSSQASKARLQSSKHTGAKHNLTQNGRSRPFKVTCFGVSGKTIKDKIKIRPYLLRFRRCSIYERSAVFFKNILRITVRFRISPLVTCVNRLYSKYVT